MKPILHEQDCFYPDIEDVREHERPSVTLTPEYRRLCGLRDEAST